MTAPNDSPLVLACPNCKAMMWAGSSKCGRCRALAGEPKPARSQNELVEKPKTRKN